MTPQLPQSVDMSTVMANMVANQNKRSEAKYQNDVASYNQAVDGWKIAESHSRELSSDPTHYVPNPPPTVPTKTVYVLNGTNITPTQWTDPSIKPPTLPAYTPPQTTNAFSALQPNLNSSESDMTLFVLTQIQSDIAKIMAVLGIS